MNVLITGAAGFIGTVLVRHCLDAGCSVLGIDRHPPQGGWAKADFELCDVRDPFRLLDLMSIFQPQRIFHLAAQSSPLESLRRPRETMDANVGGTVNLFECLREAVRTTEVIVACSSAEYGRIAENDIPVREEHALSPLHPYGISKVAQDLLAAQYFRNYGIPVIRVRIFSTTGPGKIGDVCSDLTRRTVEMELGICARSMMVGSLHSRRTFVDVRDLVRGLWLAAGHCVAGEVYNLGGDRIYGVDEVVEEIRSQVGFSFEIDPRPELMRLCDETVIAGDNSRFRSCCNWTPEIPLRTTLADMLEWWRSRLAGHANRQELTAETGSATRVSEPSIGE